MKPIRDLARKLKLFIGKIRMRLVRNEYYFYCMFDSVDMMSGAALCLGVLGYPVMDGVEGAKKYARGNGAMYDHWMAGVFESGVEWGGLNRADVKNWKKEGEMRKIRTFAPGHPVNKTGKTIVDCGSNVGLMMALSRLKGKDDRGKHFFRRMENGEEQWFINTKDRDLSTAVDDFGKPKYVKANLEDLVRHFCTKEEADSFKELGKEGK